MAGSTNRELFASDNKNMLDWFESGRQDLEDEELYAMMERTQGSLMPYESGDTILTDDKAPVELLGMRVIDELIGDEVAYYKKIYEEKGVAGLLEAF